VTDSGGRCGEGGFLALDSWLLVLGSLMAKWHFEVFSPDILAGYR